MPKRPKAVVVAPRAGRAGRDNFDPENPAHYATAYIERIANLVRAIAQRKRRNPNLPGLSVKDMAIRYEVSEAEVITAVDIVDAAFDDHAAGRRLAPYTGTVARPPRD